MGGVSIISGTLFRVRREPFPTSKIIMLITNIFFSTKMVDYLKKALIYGHTRRISSEIYYQFTTFEGKIENEK